MCRTECSRRSAASAAQHLASAVLNLRVQPGSQAATPTCVKCRVSTMSSSNLACTLTDSPVEEGKARAWGEQNSRSRYNGHGWAESAGRQAARGRQQAARGKADSPGGMMSPRNSHSAMMDIQPLSINGAAVEAIQERRNLQPVGTEGSG